VGGNMGLRARTTRSIHYRVLYLVLIYLKFKIKFNTIFFSNFLFFFSFLQSNSDETL